MRDFKSIVYMHTQLFPKATPEGQQLQFFEELEEYMTALTEEDMWKEFGDLLFVILSFRRWNNKKVIAEELLSKYYFCLSVDEQRKAMRYLNKAVEKVIKRVEKNLYHCDNGHYTRKQIYQEKNNGTI